MLHQGLSPGGRRSHIAWILAGLLAGAGQLIAADGPTLTKLPVNYGEQAMEHTPVIYDGVPLLVQNHRPGGLEAKGKDAYLFIEDLQTGRQVARFGEGHSFVCAFVNGRELNVFATEFTEFGRVMGTKGINRLVTTDLKTWKQERVISQDGGEHLFNSSVCRDDQGFLMAYESDIPVQFCFKFARSKDLAKWEKIPGLVFTGVNNEYSACPVIRYCAPYYYVTYLHAAIPGHNGWVSFLARSGDLVTWELSPRNPILEAGPGEGINNSDVDLFELDGNTYVLYATGDQATWGTVRAALYRGSMKEFYTGYFPENAAMVQVSAKRQ